MSTTIGKGDDMQSKTLTSNEKTVLKRRNLNPADYTVENRLNYVLVLRNRYTGLLKYVDKRSN